MNSYWSLAQTVQRFSPGVGCFVFNYTVIKRVSFNQIDSTFPFMSHSYTDVHISKCRQPYIPYIVCKSTNYALNWSWKYGLTCTQVNLDQKDSKSSCLLTWGVGRWAESRMQGYHQGTDGQTTAGLCLRDPNTRQHQHSSHSFSILYVV